MNDLFANTIYESARKLKIDLNESIVQEFGKYYELLVNENKKYNLTTITSPVEAAEKHFIDSLMLLPGFPSEFNISVVDVGSGAGFPGLPIKIYRKDMELTLIDSVKKKTQFLEKVVKELEIYGVKVSNERAEEHAKKHRAKYEIVVSRAVAETRVLAELTIPLVRKAGKVIISKGPGVYEELRKAERALSVLGGKVVDINEFRLPISGVRRATVVIEKIADTPDKYPRRPGMPVKRPL